MRWTHGNPKTPNYIPGQSESIFRAARAVFNIENLYLTVGDNLDRLLDDVPLAAFYPDRRNPRTASLLALLSVFQFAEDLPDRLASVEVTKRTDWKYALHLPLDYPGLDPCSLCGFLSQLADNPGGSDALAILLRRLSAIGLLCSEKRSFDAYRVLSYLCGLNQLDRMFESVVQAIEALASEHTDVLRSLAQPHWYYRYRERKPGFDPIFSASQQKTVGSTLVWRNVSCNQCPWLADESHAQRWQLNDEEASNSCRPEEKAPITEGT